MTVAQALKRPFFIIKANWFVWSKVANRHAQALLRQHRPTLSPLQERIVRDVDTDGIATVPLAELFPNGPVLDDLIAYAEKRAGSADVKTKKQFLKYYWGTDENLDLTNPFVQLSLRPEITDIADTYMGMWTRFKHYTLNLTTPVDEGEAPTHSQRWHRDPQEKRMLKVFLYLSDVDEGSGPFTYVRKSTYGKKYGHLFPQRPPEGSYPKTEDVERLISPEDMRVMTAPRGTLIFCDTTGIHRGGYATTSPRLMFTAFFSAPSYVDKPWYVIPSEFDSTSLSEYLRYKFELA